MIRKLLAPIAIALVLWISTAAVAAVPHGQIESWRNEGMVFVVRDAEGHILQHARGHLEKWVSENQQIWVVRDAEGRFLSYARGHLESWKDGSQHVVLRNADGKFIAVGGACGVGQPLEPRADADTMKVLGVY